MSVYTWYLLPNENLSLFSLSFLPPSCFLLGAEVTVGFNASEYTVSEGNGSIVVCVTLQGSIGDGTELPVTVNTQEVLGSAQGKQKFLCDMTNYTS